MSIIGRFLTSFRDTEVDPLVPGLIQRDDGTVWLVAPDGTESQVSGGGSMPGAIRMLGPFTVNFDSDWTEAFGLSVALVRAMTAGEAVVGLAWNLVTPFNDSNITALSSQVFPFEAPASGGPALDLANIDLTVSQSQGTNPGGTYFSSEVGPPISYTVDGSQAVAPAVPSPVLPLLSDGLDLYLAAPLLAGDGDAGRIDFYLYIATPSPT